MASKEHGVESIASECLSSRFLNYKNGYSAKSVPNIIGKTKSAILKNEKYIFWCFPAISGASV